MVNQKPDVVVLSDRLGNICAFKCPVCKTIHDLDSIAQDCIDSHFPPEKEEYEFLGDEDN